MRNNIGNLLFLVGAIICSVAGGIGIYAYAVSPMYGMDRNTIFLLVGIGLFSVPAIIIFRWRRGKKKRQLTTIGIAILLLVVVGLLSALIADIQPRLNLRAKAALEEYVHGHLLQEFDITYTRIGNVPDDIYDTRVEEFCGPPRYYCVIIAPPLAGFRNAFILELDSSCNYSVIEGSIEITLWDILKCGNTKDVTNPGF